MSVERRVTAENAFEIDGVLSETVFFVEAVASHEEILEVESTLAMVKGVNTTGGKIGTSCIPQGHQLIFPLLVRALPLDLDLTSTVVEAGLTDADLSAIIQKPRTFWNNGVMRRVKDVLLNTLSIAALMEDGSVKTWGEPSQGGDSEDVQRILYNVKSLAASDWAFAALRDDGRVVSWGDSELGGDYGHVRDQLVEVTQLAGCSEGFAALTRDTVITWGTPEIDIRYDDDIRPELHSIKEVMGLRSDAAFAAFRTDGVVIAWGVHGHFLLRGVRQLEASDEAFAALLHDGSVQAWGKSRSGGDASAVRHELQKVLQITASWAAFAALKENGTVTSWGSPEAGGDQGDVVDRLVNVVDITTNSTNFGSGFMATLVTGEQVSWPPDGLASQRTPQDSFRQP
ncbi:unnamed protein product [Symbiodinium microadriaticum]|nr:unnamed protein product [Symbiodinium microadriaticum]